MSQFNNIFMKQEPVSQQELQAYLNGSLSPEDMHAIELKLNEDEFSADAVEGFQGNADAFSGLNELQNEFHAKHITPKGNWSFSHTILAATCAVALTLGGIYLFSETELAPVQTAKVDVVENELILKDKIPEAHIFFVEPIEITEEIEDEVDAAIELPEKEQIKSHVVASRQPITVPASNSVNGEELEKLVNDVIVLEPLAPMIVEMPEATQPEKVVKSNVKVKYLHKFLVVDYSKLYATGIQKTTIIHELHNNTPVYQENRNDPINEVNRPDVIQTVYVEYIDYLRDAMFKYKRNNFKAALKDYHRILKQFPNDVNATFYGGLCYYNLGKTERAIQYFKNLKNSSINTFYPEAEFYLALAFRKNGQTDNGNDILKKIIADNSFYADQAKAVLGK